ncbi:hypothetical protein XthCFBP4691_11130 [Xanthomonas theicola]|uniref:Transposase IS116/IS110/IS902 C-terminal domain-containing protein n=1 Tax=Xanthomonas theicola TaxID=56464 RepID=A0A2S6ZEK8_9XANT|nr:hypothetical protein XthCFBP4691_11130 [Xanthomonas theicola]
MLAGPARLHIRLRRLGIAPVLAHLAALLDLRVLFARVALDRGGDDARIDDLPAARHESGPLQRLAHRRADLAHQRFCLSLCLEPLAPHPDRLGARRLAAVCSSPRNCWKLRRYWTLAARLHELGTVHPRKMAALVGLAPFNRDSGRWRGQRRIQGARADVRRVLSMATWASIHTGSPLPHTYARLTAAGKPAKVALVACMHTYLRWLNAIARDRAPDDPPVLASA